MSASAVPNVGVPNPEQHTDLVQLDDAFVWFGDVVALRGLDLRIGRGEVVVVSGPSGSGKSTLVGLLSGHTPLRSGRAVINGATVVSGQRAPASENIHVVSQGAGRELVSELTVRDNLTIAAVQAVLPKSDQPDAVQAALDRFAVANLADRMPSSLAGGEAQRVALAVATVGSPTLLIADEPTGELDRMGADDVYDALRNWALQRGVSLLVVTHDRGADRIADRTVELRDGRLTAEVIKGHHAAVVDARGWLRLTDPIRSGLGNARRVELADHQVGAVVRPVGARHPRPHHLPESDRTPFERVTVERVELLRVERLTAPTIAVTTQHGAPLSFVVAQGELVAVTGPSGSGKTTLLSIIASLRPASGGRVHCGPVDVYSAHASSAPGVRVDELLDVAKLIRPPAPTARHAPQRWLVDDHHDLLELLGLNGLRNRYVDTLSGGERQRVAFLRAVLGSRALLIADEPTSQLDDHFTDRMVELIRQQTALGRGLLVATHDERFIRHVDRVVRLEP
jgi:putative ABC transport system ATP-binding protein